MKKSKTHKKVKELVKKIKVLVKELDIQSKEITKYGYENNELRKLTIIDELNDTVKEIKKLKKKAEKKYNKLNAGCITDKDLNNLFTDELDFDDDFGDIFGDDDFGDIFGDDASENKEAQAKLEEENKDLKKKYKRLRKKYKKLKKENIENRQISNFGGITGPAGFGCTKFGGGFRGFNGHNGLGCGFGSQNGFSSGFGNGI